MSRLHLIVEFSRTKPGARVSVDDAMLIGDYVGALVSDLGYPQKDSTGSPVTYQLRVISQQQPLPSARRFAEMGVAPGTRLVLESATANYATVPMAPAAPHAAQPAERSQRRFGRRQALVAGFLTFCTVTGLSSGLAVALAQKRRNAPPQLTTATRATPVPRVATARLTFSDHRQTVRALGWSPDGYLLASGADDGLLLVWGTNGAVQSRLVHPAPVLALAWSPESQRIVTGAANQVSFLSARTGAVLASRAEPHAAPISALAWTEHNQLQAVSGGLDRKAVVWSTTDYTPQTIFTRHAAAIEGISWAADGQTIASCSHGGVVRVWNAESGQETHALFQDGQEPLRALAFAPAGTTLAVGGDDGITRLWKDGLKCQVTGTEDDALVCRDAPLRLQGLASAIRSVAWSPDGRFLASGNNEGVCTLWSLDLLQPLFSFAVAPGQPMNGLSWSPAGGEIATAAGNTVTVWSLHPSQ